jgi:predicted NUDIX family NTP pyrophosphohydrolase
MPKQSAGILLYRKKGISFEVLLVHPGGPYWVNKDLASWSIPKGEYGSGEDKLETAKREFEEETGFSVSGNFIQLTPRRQKTGKIVDAWALEGGIDADKIESNHFELEWPPRSGKKQSFPEVDRAGWFAPDEARKKLVPGQAGFIDELEEILGSGGGSFD